MKVISRDRSNSREKKLLEREIQILSDMKKFKHENIVQYVEFFHLGCDTYIIMEYCEGGTLFEYIRKHGVVPEHIFVDFVRQIASGFLNS
jgi:serine/threonine protein kinase